MSDAIPAATVVIFRERENGSPEVLMLERAKAMVFAAGALVFPGGRIDPGDEALAATMAGAPNDTAARIAAIRETIEETGLAIGLSTAPDHAALARIREGLHGGVPFAELLADAGLRLALDALTPFARWCPAHAHARIFDTRFYLARLPKDAPTPRVDATENVRLFWASAEAVLAEAAAGRARIIFPTRRNLERLARFATFADALADAARHPVRTITPWIERRDGADHLCIDNDLGYPVTTEALDSAMRS
ncbi:MAG TPA: NUDIX domain-containing protein [Sphingomonas sp.]|nr:NUDIX domain-containing protein [Sphingomonas sp.]